MEKTTSQFRLGCLMLALAVTASACGGSDRTNDVGRSGTDTSTDEINKLRVELEALKAPSGLTNAAAAPVDATQTGTPTTEQGCSSGSQALATVNYSLQKYSASAVFDTQTLLNPSTDVIYPGSVLIGSSIADGSYVEVVKGAKKDLTVSYGGLNAVTKGGTTGTVSGTFYPTLSGFRELHNKIIGQDFSGANSTFTLNVADVTTESSFDFHMGADVTYKSLGVSAGVKANFDYTKTTEQHKYLIRFAQTYFTVDVDQGADSFLYADFDIDDFNGYRPVYVSSLAYGRLGYITLESSASSEDIQASINALFSGVSWDVDAGATTSYSSLENSSNINITVIGSNTTFASLQDFQQWIKEGGFSSTSTGQVVAYKLRFVHDNSIANTVFNGEYTTRQAVSNPVAFSGVTAQLTGIEYACTDEGNTAELSGSIVAHAPNNDDCNLLASGRNVPVETWNYFIDGGTCAFKNLVTSDTISLTPTSIVDYDTWSANDSYSGKRADFLLKNLKLQSTLQNGPVMQATYEADADTFSASGNDGCSVYFLVHVKATASCTASGS